MKRRLIAFLAGAMVLLAALSFAQTADVPAGHWAREAVEILVERGILQGYPDGTFRGDKPLSRYELALALYRFLRLVESEVKATGFSPTLASLEAEELSKIVQAIGSLSGIVAEIDLRVTALEAQKEKQEEVNLEELFREAAAQVEARLTTLVTTIEGLAARLADLEGRADALERRGDRTEEAVEDASALAGAIYRDLVELRRAHEGLSATVRALAAQVQELAARPAVDQEARARIASLEQSLAELRQRVEAQEKKAATPPPAAFKTEVSGEGNFTLASPGLEPLGVAGPQGRGTFSVGLAGPDWRVALEGGAALGTAGVLPEAGLRGSLGGLEGSLRYSGYLAFGLSPFLMRNEDPKGTVVRQGVALDLAYGEASLKAVYGEAGNGSDATPALSGSFWGVRAGYGPLSVAYGSASGRVGLGGELSLREGPFSLSAAGASTALLGSSPIGAGADVAYQVRAGYEAGGLRVEAKAHGIDKDYAEGQAGMSQDARTPYYSQRGTPTPGTFGLSGRLEASGTPLDLALGFVAEGDNDWTPGSFSVAAGGRLGLEALPNLRVFGFYNAAFAGGNSPVDFANEAAYGAGYDYRSLDRLGASAFGGGVEWRGPVRVAISGARHPVEGATEIRGQVEGRLEGSINVAAKGLGSYFSAPGTDSGSGFLVGGQVEGKAGAGEWEFSLKGSYGLVLFLGDGSQLPFRYGMDEGRLDVSLAYRLGATTLRAGYGLYWARNLPGLVGQTGEEPLASWEGSAPPWFTVPSPSSTSLQSLRFGVTLSSLSTDFYVGRGTAGDLWGFRIGFSFGDKR